MPTVNPLFSVVISTYNYGHLVERAVQSVLTQGFGDYELIVVDDGSTDDTQQKLESYGDRLRYVKKQNGGQSSACNLGAQQALGTYVYILDADDELLPSALGDFARVINRLNTDKRAALFYGDYISVSEKGEKRERQSPEIPKNARSALSAFLRKKIPGLKHGAFVIPRTAYSKIRHPENIRNNTDIVFIGQALTMFPAINIHATVLKSHEHSQRTRNQLDKILATGILPVDTLFDPKIVPAELMSLRSLYLAQRWRSIARLLYLHGRYAEARRAYADAFKASPFVMLEWGSVRRAIMSFFKN